MTTKTTKGFPTTKAALNRALRKDIFASFKRMGNCTKQDRLFPTHYGVADWPMVTTTFTDTGEIRIDYVGDPVYPAHQVAEYVREFCRLNHLKGA